MKEYTPGVAKWYDKALFIAMFRIRKRMVKVAKELKVSRIFDLCCGTGNQLKYFKKSGFNDVVGVDLSENMISVANNSKIKLNCLLEDATNTSFKDNSFDFGMVSFALHEKSIEIAEAMILEAGRLIKNGGYFVIVDYCFDKNSTSLGRWASTFVEKLVGGNHYKNFKKYINAGGLNFLMGNYKSIKEYPFIFGSVKMRIYQF